MDTGVLICFILLAFLCAVIGHHCVILGKRIDIVHKRISQHSKINGLLDTWEER